MTPSDSNQTTNPYESPKEKSLPAPQQQIARLIDRGWLYRKVQLPGPLATTIEYNGRGFGFETVLVDSKIASRETSWCWYVPHFDFVVPADSGELAASIDVRISPWFTLSRIVIRIEGTDVYAEL